MRSITAGSIGRSRSRCTMPQMPHMTKNLSG
jgi:hypothetical protein